METHNLSAGSHTSFRARLAAIFMAAMACVAGPAVAEGWYVGASSGKIENRNWCDVNLGACDDKDKGWKVFAGKQVNSFVGFEFGYNDLGELTDTGTTAEADGVVASLVGTIPMGDVFSMMARVGAFRWDNDVRSTNSSLARNRDGTNLAVGIGMNARLAKRFAVRVEWERYDVDDDDISLMSAGVIFSFGK